MKKFFNLLMAICLLVTAASCNKPKEPVVTLEAVETQYTIGAKGGSVNVEISTNVEPQVKCDSDWISYTKTKSEEAADIAAGVTSYNFTVEPNKGEQRTAEIVFSYEEKSVTVTVTQEAKPETVIEAEQTEYSIGAEGGDLTFSIITNVEPEFTSDAEWTSYVGAEKGEASDDAASTITYTFTVSPNPGDPRTANIVFTCEDKSLTVAVSQEAVPSASLTVPDEIPCVCGLGVVFDYQLTGEIQEGTTISVEGDGWEAEIAPAEGGNEGRISLKAPKDAQAADVNILVSDIFGLRYSQKLNINLIQQGARLEYYAYHCFDRKTPFTHDRFVKMGEAGVRVAHSFGPKDFEEAAAAAEGADVKLVGYMEDYIYNYVNWTDADYKEFIAHDQALIDRVNMYKKHENLWGYNLIDEPRDSLFVKIGMLVDRLHELDPNHPTYVNLWGDQMNDDCLEAYIRDAHPDQVCFDHYAVTSGKADVYWYTRLESLFRICVEKYKMPWWGFAASADINDYPPGVTPPPTAGSLRLYHYTLLAYGATNTMYFTWLHYTGENGGRGWTVAPLMQDGSYSYVYDLIKAETEEIDNHMFIFRNSDFKGVRHAKKDNSSQGVTLLKSADDPFMPECIDWWEFRTGAMLSKIENNGNEYLLIEGKGLGSNTKFSFGFKKDIWRVTSNGWFEPVKWQNGEVDNEYFFNLEPGEPLILKTR